MHSTIFFNRLRKAMHSLISASQANAIAMDIYASDLEDRGLFKNSVRNGELFAIERIAEVQALASAILVDIAANDPKAMARSRDRVNAKIANGEIVIAKAKVIARTSGLNETSPARAPELVAPWQSHFLDQAEGPAA